MAFGAVDEDVVVAGDDGVCDFGGFHEAFFGKFDIDGAFEDAS